MSHPSGVVGRFRHPILTHLWRICPPLFQKCYNFRDLTICSPRSSPSKGTRRPARAARPEASGAPTNKGAVAKCPAPARRLGDRLLHVKTSWRGRGSGVAIPNAEFCHPGRSLVLSRGRESTNLTRKTSCKEKINKRQGVSFSVRHVAARVTGFFAAVRAVSRIRWILERRVLFCAAAQEQGFHPCTPPGPPRPCTRARGIAP